MDGYTRYARVLDAAGEPLSVREVLALINQILDEVLAEQEGDFDADSRWALAWFEQHGFAEGDYGDAETLSKAKNTSVAGMVEAGILVSRGGTVKLLAPGDLPKDWDPKTDSRLTAWEAVHHLIRGSLTQMAKKVRQHWRPTSAEWRKLHANSATGYTQCASGGSGPRKLFHTTVWFRAGRK